MTDAVTGSTYKRQKRGGNCQKNKTLARIVGREVTVEMLPLGKECPAYGTGLWSLYTLRVPGRAKTKSNRTSEQESAVFDILCELTIQHNMASISMFMINHQTNG